MQREVDARSPDELGQRQAAGVYEPETEKRGDDAEPEIKVSSEAFAETDDERPFSAEGILLPVAVIVHHQ